MSEFIFVLYILLISVASLLALKIGKEALIAVIAIESVFISFMIPNSMNVFGLYSEASEALLVAAGVGLNLVHEYFGENAVKKSIATSTLCSFFFTFAFYIHVTYGGLSDNCLINFLAITPRILIAACISFFIGQNFEAYLYTKFLEIESLKNRFLLRNYIVTLIGQLLGTGIFTLLAWYGTSVNIGAMLFSGFFLKVIIILLVTPFLALSKIIMRPHASI